MASKKGKAAVQATALGAKPALKLAFHLLSPADRLRQVGII